MISFITLLAVVVLAVTIVFVLLKWLHNYREGKITRAILVRNIFLEIFVILLAMALAGLFGRYLAQLVTARITNELTKFIAGIVIGLLAGVGVALLVKRIGGRLTQAYIITTTFTRVVWDEISTVL